jgi:hypothetical protein
MHEKTQEIIREILFCTRNVVRRVNFLHHGGRINYRNGYSISYVIIIFKGVQVLLPSLESIS